MEVPYILKGLMLGLAFIAIHAHATIRARNKERDRVVRLCNRSLNRRLSGHVRWVLNAVHSGADELMPEDEFFEKTPVTDKRGCPAGQASVWVYSQGQWRILSIVQGRKQYYPKPEGEVANEGQLIGDPDLIRAMCA